MLITNPWIKCFYVEGFRIVKDEELEQLEIFLKKNDIEANIESFARGVSVFNLDQHSKRT